MDFLLETRRVEVTVHVWMAILPFKYQRAQNRLSGMYTVVFFFLFPFCFTLENIFDGARVLNVRIPQDIVLKYLKLYVSSASLRRFLLIINRKMLSLI